MIFEQSLRQRPAFDQETDILRSEAGWDYIQGDNTTSISEGVTFGSAFSSRPITVQVTFLGVKAGVPSHIGDFGSTVAGTSVVIEATAITTNGFTPIFRRSDGSTFGVGTYFGYTWLAIGEK